MNITIICGSPRKDSYTRILIKFVHDYAKENHKNINYLDVIDEDIQRFRGFEVKYNKRTQEIKKIIENTDYFIIGTPIYNGFISAHLKSLFEHVNYKAFKKATAGFVLQSGGQISYLQVQSQLTSLMKYFGVLSNPNCVFSSRSNFEGDKISEDIKERLKEMFDSTLEIKR